MKFSALFLILTVCIFLSLYTIIDLSTPHSPVILYYGSFQGDTSVVVLLVLCFGVEFLCCCLNIMHVFIFLLCSGN